MIRCEWYSLHTFSNVQTMSCFDRTRLAMFGWPSASNRSMWIPAGELSRQKIYVVSAWRVLPPMSYTSLTMTTGWRMPILWSGLKSAGAGNPSLINCRNFLTSAKRSFLQKTDRKIRTFSTLHKQLNRACPSRLSPLPFLVLQAIITLIVSDVCI